MPLGSAGPMRIQTVIPQLRITHADRSLHFYEHGLGFVIDWTHQFKPDFPLFLQLTRNGQTIWISQRPMGGPAMSVAGKD